MNEEKKKSHPEDPDFPKQETVETIEVENQEELVCSPEFPDGCMEVED